MCWRCLRAQERQFLSCHSSWLINNFIRSTGSSFTVHVCCSSPVMSLFTQLTSTTLGTMSEIEKALAELKALMKYRAEQLGYEEDFRGLGLTSRKNLCLHPSVKREKSGAVVDARCRSLTAGFVKEKKERGEDVELCVYHDVGHSLLSPSFKKRRSDVANLETQNLDLLEPHNLVPNGVWTLDGLLRYGEEHKQCPYFTSRRMVCHPRLGILTPVTYVSRCNSATSSFTPTTTSWTLRLPIACQKSYRRTAS